jgi:hypothetical protein
MSYGVPLSIQAPEGALVQELDLLIMKEINIKKGDFHLQLFIHKPLNENGDSLLWHQMEAVSGSSGFIEFTDVESSGFIYSIAPTKDKIIYGFRYLMPFDSSYLLARQHPRIEPTYNEIREMYESVKSARILTTD